MTAYEIGLLVIGVVSGGLIASAIWYVVGRIRGPKIVYRRPLKEQRYG